MARTGERPPIGLTWIVSWPLSAAFAALVFLSAEELQHPSREIAPAPAPAIGGADWNRRLPDRIAAVDKALHHAPGLHLPAPIEEPRGSGPLRWTHRLYDITLTRDDEAQAASAIEAVRGADPGLAVTAENTSNGTDVLLGLDGLLISTLRFRWAAVVPATPTPKPQLAVVIGPLGDDLRAARAVVAIDAPITLGVRPLRPFSREVAALAQMFKRDMLIEMDGSEARAAYAGDAGAATPGPDLAALLESVPQAVGVLWLSGAKGRKPDRALLDQIAQRHLLFVGQSATPPGLASALPAATVLDGAQPEALAGELSAAADKARADGVAVAIGSPDETVLAAIAQALTQWQGGEVEVVSVSALAAPAALSAR
jgi:polysaccharide deacetylase 2 family uncharacterized protein YibQ